MYYTNRQTIFHSFYRDYQIYLRDMFGQSVFVCQIDKIKSCQSICISDIHEAIDRHIEIERLEQIDERIRRENRTI